MVLATWTVQSPLPIQRQNGPYLSETARTTTTGEATGPSHRQVGRFEQEEHPMAPLIVHVIHELHPHLLPMHLYTNPPLQVNSTIPTNRPNPQIRSTREPSITILSPPQANTRSICHRNIPITLTRTKPHPLNPSVPLPTRQSLEVWSNTPPLTL
mgnify:CR=1 FL=1